MLSEKYFIRTFNILRSRKLCQFKTYIQNNPSSTFIFVIIYQTQFVLQSQKFHNPLTLIYGYIYCANNGVSNQPIQFLQGLSAIFCCLPLHLAFFFARRKDSRIHRPKSAKIAFLLHSGATITVIPQGCRVSNFRSCYMQLKKNT